MNQRRWLGSYLCLIVLAAGLSGCTDASKKRYAVSGTVTWQGKPLDHGAIMFLDLDPVRGPVGATMIQDGQYKLPANQGLLPGRYKVSISSSDPRNKAPDPDSPPGYLPLTKDRIQAKYNTQTTLSAEVKAEGPNRFDFEVH